MSELLVPQFNLEFYQEPGCLPLQGGARQYELARRHTLDHLNSYYRDQIALAENAEVAKLAWFQAAEADARLFMSSLAFDDLMPMVMFKQDSEGRFFGIDAPKSAIAVQEPYGILVKRSAIERVRLLHGELKAAGVLVHELAHATATPKRVGVHMYARQRRRFVYGNGWFVGDETDPKGIFYEEGFAEFMAGWYIRSRESAGVTPVLSLRGRPAKALPAHYNFSISDNTITGPDGYAMELLAWGLQRKRRMTANDFVSVMLETRRPETAAPARREFAQAIESLRPGLYKKLRDLPYSRENWQAACDLVHSIVTE